MASETARIGKTEAFKIQALKLLLELLALTGTARQKDSYWDQGIYVLD